MDLALMYKQSSFNEIKNELICKKNAQSGTKTDILFQYEITAVVSNDYFNENISQFMMIKRI